MDITYSVGSRDFKHKADAVKLAREYANEDGRPVTVYVFKRKTDAATKTRGRALGYSVMDMTESSFEVLPSKGRPNPGGLYGDAKTAFGYGYSAGEARGRHDEAGYRFHHDSYRKWLSAYSFRQPIEVKREAEEEYAKGYAEAMEYRHRPNPTGVPNEEYAVWTYSNAPGAGSPTVQHFKSFESAMRAMSELVRYGTAKKIQLIHVRTGQALHTWEGGSWKLGRGKSNPGKGWFTRCIDSVSASGSAVDPGAVCGAQLKKMGYKRNPSVPPFEAKQILDSLGIADADFHALTYAQTDKLIQLADRYGYRKPKSASGSRARYFFQQLQRAAARWRKNKRTRNAGPWSIRKHKKALKKDKYGTPVTHGWQPGIRATRPRGKPRTMSNPRRYTLRSAGREFTVLAKSMKAAWKEVRAWLRKEGIGINRKRNTTHVRGGPVSDASISRLRRKKAAQRLRDRQYKRKHSRNAYPLLPAGVPQLRIGTNVEIWKSSAGYSVYHEGQKYGTYSTLDKAREIGRTLKDYRANRRRPKRNRSVSMLVPRARRKTVKSVERRTSAALGKYLGGRRRY